MRFAPGGIRQDAEIRRRELRVPQERVQRRRCGTGEMPDVVHGCAGSPGVPCRDGKFAEGSSFPETRDRLPDERPCGRWLQSPLNRDLS